MLLLRALGATRSYISYQGFSGTNPPPLTWRPGDATSIFNTAVNKSNVHAKSQTKVNLLISFDDNDTPRGMANLVIPDRTVTGESAAHAIVFAKTTDPLFTIDQSATWFPSMEGEQCRIPAQAEAGQDGFDYQLESVQPDGMSYLFWQFERPSADPDGSATPGTYIPRNASGGGTVRCSSAAKGRIDDNLLTDVGDVTQGGFHLAAGQIRGEEMQAGRINHGLFLVVPGQSRSGSFISPTTKSPQAPAGGTDQIDVGQRFFLNYTAAEIDALALASWEKIIYKAFAEFGGVVGDGGGSSSVLMSIEPTSASGYTPFGTTDPWVQYAATQVSVSGGRYSLIWTQGVIDWANRLKVAA